MRQVIRDVHAELLREIVAVIEGQTRLVGTGGLPPVVITGASSTPWFSATFSGRRHILEVALSGAGPAVIAARDTLVARLQDAEFELIGHFVAGLAVSPLGSRREGDRTICELRVEALTIED